MKRVTIWTKKKILYFEKHFKDEDHQLIDWSVICGDYRWHLKNPTVKQWPWTHHRTFFRQPFTVVTISPTLKRNTDTPDCRDSCQTCQHTHSHSLTHTDMQLTGWHFGTDVPQSPCVCVCVWSSAEHRRIRAQLVSLHVAPSPAAFSLPVTAEITWLWLHKTPSTERPGGSLMG